MKCKLKGIEFYPRIPFWNLGDTDKTDSIKIEFDFNLNDDELKNEILRRCFPDGRTNCKNVNTIPRATVPDSHWPRVLRDIMIDICSEMDDNNLEDMIIKERVKSKDASKESITAKRRRKGKFTGNRGGGVGKQFSD